MITPVQPEEAVARTELDEEFSRRLSLALPTADHERRRRAVYRRARSLLPIILLVGPLIGWRLILATPDAVHLAISMLAWVAFVLDIGVHLDTSLLTYLGLQSLPTIVGGLLLVVLTGWLLGSPKGHQ